MTYGGIIWVPEWLTYHRSWSDPDGNLLDEKPCLTVCQMAQHRVDREADNKVKLPNVRTNLRTLHVLTQRRAKLLLAKSWLEFKLHQKADISHLSLELWVLTQSGLMTPSQQGVYSPWPAQYCSDRQWDNTHLWPLWWIYEKEWHLLSFRDASYSLALKEGLRWGRRGRRDCTWTAFLHCLMPEMPVVWSNPNPGQGLSHLLSRWQTGVSLNYFEMIFTGEII